MKLVVTDLDGTLFQDNQTITPYDLDAIKRAEEKNTKVIVATGRQYLTARKLLEKLGFLPEYIICDNGCSIYSTKNDLQLSSFPLNKNIVYDVLTILEKEDFYYSISTDTCRVSLNNSLPILEREFFRNKARISDLDRYHLDSLVDLFKSNQDLNHTKSRTKEEICDLDMNFYNVTAITFDPQRIVHGQASLSNINGISVVSSAYNNFEAINESCSKGNALKHLADHLNINLNNIMTIGDNFNDVSMLKIVENSVAMGNAHDDIKNMCKYVTLKNTESGVGYAINNFIK